ncbi:tautomerase family protein [Rhodomicrobium sp.]|uniref:tautomerase family protein n=1 Tax=Rhodomicrobium sp. TaxID=2720632 RepID=UPI0039E6C2BA
MPFARLTITPTPLQENAQALAAELTDLIAHDLGKHRDLTSVLVETTGSQVWTIGASERASAAHLEVYVTAGTNSEDEKRTFIANAMALLRRAYPNLGAATYVVVKQLPATDWGYDGRTQADRAKERPMRLR